MIYVLNMDICCDRNDISYTNQTSSLSLYPDSRSKCLKTVKLELAFSYAKWECRQRTLVVLRNGCNYITPKYL